MQVEPERIADLVAHPGRHPDRHQPVGDPRRHRPEPVRDGAAVPVPRVRRRDPAAARGARRARRQRQGGQPLRQGAGAGAGGRRDRRAPDHDRAAAGGSSGTGAQLVARRPRPPVAGRQDRHQQRRPRQLVRRLDRRPPRGGLGRQRPEPEHRPVRRHRRDAGVVGDLLAAADRAAQGRRRRPRLAVGDRREHHRRRLRRRAPLRVRAGLRARLHAVPGAAAGLRRSRRRRRQGGGWRDWFGFGDRDATPAEPDPAKQLPPPEDEQ